MENAFLIFVLYKLQFAQVAVVGGGGGDDELNFVFFYFNTSYKTQWAMLWMCSRHDHTMQKKKEKKNTKNKIFFTHF